VTVAWPRRFKHIPATTNTAADLTADFCVIDGNLSFNTIKLRGCSFSSNFSLTTVGALTCDLESFKNLISSSVVVTGVSSFVANFPRAPQPFGASVATSGQFLLYGGPSAVSTATEGSGQIQMAASYAIIGLRARSLTNSSTVTVRKGGASQSMTCAPAAGGNASDAAIGHWVTGNADDLISVIVGGTAGGLVRAVLELVLL
jgi:hypothetical protein